jgi:hypothetical protein
VISIVLAGFFSSSLFITPLYKSYAIVYPSNISPYSDESETEQMIQMMQSKEIRDSLIVKFDLPHHYGIDPSYEYYMSTLLWEFKEKVKIGKTPYEAVSIEVLDKDPKVACDMVNEMMNQYNLKVRSLHKEKFWEVVLNYRTITAMKAKDLDSLKARTEELGMKFGLMDYAEQTREVMRAYLGTGNGPKRPQEAEKLKKNLEEKGGEMLLLSELMRSEAEGYSTFKLDNDRAIMNYNREYSYVNVLNKPFPADKKSYPVRWVIVLISTLATFFLAVLAIGVIEGRRSRKGVIVEHTL